MFIYIYCTTKLLYTIRICAYTGATTTKSDKCMKWAQTTFNRRLGPRYFFIIHSLFLLNNQCFLDFNSHLHLPPPIFSPPPRVFASLVSVFFFRFVFILLITTHHYPLSLANARWPGGPWGSFFFSTRDSRRVTTMAITTTTTGQEWKGTNTAPYNDEEHK